MAQPKQRTPNTRPDEAPVEAIAEDTEAPKAEVREMLTEATEDLLATSKVKTFVGVLASKRVKRKLKKQKSKDLAKHSR